MQHHRGRCPARCDDHTSFKRLHIQMLLLSFSVSGPAVSPLERGVTYPVPRRKVSTVTFSVEPLLEDFTLKPEAVSAALTVGFRSCFDLCVSPSQTDTVTFSCSPVTHLQNAVFKSVIFMSDFLIRS